MSSDLALVLRVVRQRLADVAALYVFGSEARGDTHVASDLDLAVLADRPLGTVERFDIQEAIAAELGRDVDLVDLRAASTVMQMQIVSTGHVVADLDASSRAAFETFVYSSYAMLNEERAGVLEAIAERGRVYGG